MPSRRIILQIILRYRALRHLLTNHQHRHSRTAENLSVRLSQNTRRIIGMPYSFLFSNTYIPNNTPNLLRLHRSLSKPKFSNSSPHLQHINQLRTPKHHHQLSLAHLYPLVPYRRLHRHHLGLPQSSRHSAVCRSRLPNHEAAHPLDLGSNE